MKNILQILLMYLLIINVLSVQAKVNESDSLELVHLYHTTNGNNWTDNSGWLVEPVAEWLGITLDSTNTNVAEIQLEDNNLTGTLPNLQLENLAFLSLDTNQLNGTIPNFDYLPELAYLSLYDNKLSGEIPNFDQLPNLESLDLGKNQLIGAIPDFDHLPKLLYLSLAINELSGTIPNFTNLPALVSLELQTNQLSASVPNFEHLPQLVYLMLADNQLSGAIPNFQYLPELVWLTLSDNQLSGEVPNFDQVPNLNYLELYENQLSGTVPNFEYLPNLGALLLKNNQLSGTIPNFEHLPKLRYLWLSNNQISGTIPNFEYLPQLVYLKLSENQLTGTIPSFEYMPQLVHLMLADNQLTGTIPDFEHLPQLIQVTLSNNQLSGTVPDFNYFTELEVLHLQNNNFTFSGLEENVIGLNLTCNHEYFDPCFAYAPQDPIAISLNNKTLSVSVAGTLSNNTYTWFKDGEQIAEIVGDSTLSISETGIYSCEMTNSIATELTLFTDSVTVDNIALCRGETDCIWPGDTNNDGVVNHNDLLNIGRAYNTNGMARTPQSISWQAKYCEAWDSTFANQLNYKHADCNGDGIVNAADTTAIMLNYRQVRNKTNASVTAQDGIPLFAVFEKTIIDSIEHVFSIHLGNPTTLAENIYGIAFTLRSQVANAVVRINEPMLDFNNSWLNNENGNIISLDSCFNQNTSEWTWDIAITRTNHKNTTGLGEICRVGCIMDIISVDGKSKTKSVPLTLHIENVSLLSYEEEVIPTNNSPQIVDIFLQDDLMPTSTNENIIFNNANITLFPNPISANRQLTINYPNQQPILIQLYDMTGKLLLSEESKEQNQHQLHIPDLAMATYFVKIVDNKNAIENTQKVIVIE